MRYSSLFLLLLLASPLSLFSQSRTYDIDKEDLPVEVEKALIKYVELLRSDIGLNKVSQAFVGLAGGSLVNEDGQSLRSSVKPYSLKKDYQNIKYYAYPLRITRVNRSPTPRSSGYGASAIQGTVYKIWIDKAEGQNGLPAPVSILVPEGHPSIHQPKIVGIGSF